MEKPNVFVKRLDSDRTMIRFNELHELYWYDKRENNPEGIAVSRIHATSAVSRRLALINYINKRSILTEEKKAMISKAKKSLSIDKDFLTLVYKAKSEKRGFEMSKFGGILSIPCYSRGEDKMFKKPKIGKKKNTINMAFQVGVLCNGDYENSFISIIKTILMAQALNISLNIDMFDSDKRAPEGGGYVICSIAKSNQKLNLKNILACSHEEFFNYSLFNGYSAAGKSGFIDQFLSEKTIIKDLSQYYDIIGGSMLSDKHYDSTPNDSMISKILKIAWK